MLSVIIGTDSYGIKVSKSLSALHNLFVSYIEYSQVNQLISSLLTDGTEDIGRLLVISKSDNLINIDNFIYAETYIYNNPDLGTIKDKSKLFTQIIKDQQRQQKGKYANSKKTLIWIDDMWLFYPKLKSRTAINHFRELLQHGYENNIHFVIGSILPYINLLMQLMKSDSIGGKKQMVSTLGAELIYTSDDLIFFRELNAEVQEMYYTLAMENSTI